MRSDLERNKAVVRRFLDVVSDGGDLSVMDEVCAPDVLNHAARPGLQDGLDAFKQLMAFIQAAQSERRWTQQQYVAEGDLVIVYGVRQERGTPPNSAGSARLARDTYRLSSPTCSACPTDSSKNTGLCVMISP